MMLPTWMNGEWIPGKVKQIMENRRMTKPTCYGKQPNNTSHLYAEYDCRTCAFRVDCENVTIRVKPMDPVQPMSEVTRKCGDCSGVWFSDTFCCPGCESRNTYQVQSIIDETSTLGVSGKGSLNTKGENIGFKQDQDKPRWSLLPKGAVVAILAVLEFGAAKYAVDNWKHVQDYERRYYDAAMRHIEAWRTKEANDPESRLPHLAHAVCCLLFLMWFDSPEGD